MKTFKDYIATNESVTITLPKAKNDQEIYDRLKLLKDAGIEAQSGGRSAHTDINVSSKDVTKAKKLLGLNEKDLEDEVNEALPKGFIAYNTMIVLAQALRKGAGELNKHVEERVIRRFELDNSVSVSKLQGIEIAGYNFGLRDIEVAIKYAVFKLDSGETESIKNITYQIPMI